VPIKVFIVDDHQVVRQGLRFVLAQHSGFQVVGEAADGAEALLAYDRIRPDVTLMDGRMPGMDGMRAIAAIRVLDPGARILVFTSFGTRTEVERALAAGAMGVLLKDASSETLVAALVQIWNGIKFLDPGIQCMHIPTGMPGLSRREVEVLTWLGQGYRNQDIAAELGLSLSTVKVHLSHIMEKLGAEDRIQAVTIAIRDGIIRC
jgi:DNA-binding NarL/FixJ family response regulator